MKGIAVSFALFGTEKFHVFIYKLGIGNATDPITNLCEQNIYNIPLILIIGWGHQA